MIGRKMTLSELFNETEQRALSEHQEREAALKAEWDAMSPDERQIAIQSAAARYDAMFGDDSICDECMQPQNYCVCDDNYCDGCELPHDVCACDDGDEE